MPDDDDELDGCDLDFAEHADDIATQSLRALFPDGSPAKADEWETLFGGAQQ